MTPPNRTQDVEHGYADVGEVRLHYVQAGSGPLMILLHGFPDCWYTWRHQIPALAAAGFHVVAPDMRGYNRSDKPRGVDAYRIEHLCRDVAGLLDHFGARKAHLAGHDWGAAVAWAFAVRYPDRLDRLAILNVPHPLRLADGLRSWRQWLRSWYILFFQLPWLPEAAIRARNYALLRWVFRRDPVRPGAFTPEDVERHVEAVAQPGALTAMIHYYRAFVRTAAAQYREAYRRIEAPVLVLWGDRDRYLGRELAEPPREWVPNAEVIHFPEASHWIQHDQPEEVSRLLIRFFAGETSR